MLISGVDSTYELHDPTVEYTNSKFKLISKNLLKKMSFKISAFFKNASRILI